MSSLFSVEYVTPKPPFYPMLGVRSPREVQPQGNVRARFWPDSGIGSSLGDLIRVSSHARAPHSAPRKTNLV
jgi:hypothetical protein